MSPRPRRISDQALLEITAQLVTGRGGENVRFTDVAAASGLAASTLVQRFGTRDKMLEAVTSMLTHQIGASFRVATPSSLSRIKAALTRIAEAAPLRFLIQHGAPAFSLEIRKQIAFCLAEAVESREIAPCDVAESARRIQLAYYGQVMASLLEGTSFEHGTWTATIDEHGQ